MRSNAIAFAFQLSIAFCALSIAIPASAHGIKHANESRAGAVKAAEEAPFGVAADPRKAERTMRVEMADTMRFTPSEIRLKRGESVRFVIVNHGKILHEMVLGTLENLKKNADLLKKNPGMQHDEPYMAHVAAGKTGEIGWRFSKIGTFYYGCLIPGHFEAGMTGKVIVE